MDLSKLPKFSETPKPPDNDPPPDNRPGDTQRPIPDYGAHPPPVVGPEAFISIAIGLFLLLFQPRFAQWLFHRLLGTRFDPFIDNVTQQVVPYTHTSAFWMDLGPFLFAVVLIVEGLVMWLVRKPVLIAITLGLTALASAYNLIYVFASYGHYGFAPISFLAGVFGAYICYFQWKYLRLLRTGQQAPMT